jgi:hypothetical protein
MQFLIFHAGLETETERRVRLAARTLTAHGIEALVAPWEGVRCAFAVTSAADAYGRHVADIARRRSLPLLVLGDDGSEATVAETRIDPSASLSTIARAMLNLLQRDAAPAPAVAQRPRPPSPTPSTVVVGPAVDPAAPPHPMVRLATDLRDVDVEVRFGSRALHVLRDRGRIVCRSFSDLVEARDRMWMSDVRLLPLRSAAANDLDLEVSASLDGFLLSAASREFARLPHYPEHACKLQDWPDLGSDACPPDLIRLVALLTKAAHRPSEAARALDIDPRLTTGFYWSLDAAGLLQRAVAASSPTPIRMPPKADSLLYRLAARFGYPRR